MILIHQTTHQTTHQTIHHRTPYAKILNVTQEHNAIVDGKRGIKFVVKFDVFHMNGKKCSLISYIYFDNGGDKFINSSAEHRATDNQVCGSVDFTPTMDGVDFSGWSAFIPYDSFSPLLSKTKLKAQLRIYDFDDQKFLDDGNTWSYFTWR
jgi:hypothetical protein